MTPGDQRPGVSLGDIVYTADGHRLGEVVTVHQDQFVGENGLVFRRYYILGLGEITDSNGRVLTTSLTLDETKTREQR